MWKSRSASSNLVFTIKNRPTKKWEDHPGNAGRWPESTLNTVGWLWLLWVCLNPWVSLNPIKMANFGNTPLLTTKYAPPEMRAHEQLMSSKAENSDCSWVQGEAKVNERKHLLGCQFLKPPWVYHIKLRCSGKLSTDILSQALTSHHIYKTSYAAVTGDEPRKQWY